MTRDPDAWSVVSAPIHHIKPPRLSMSFKPVIILGVIALAIGALIAAAQIFEVMPWGL